MRKSKTKRKPQSSNRLIRFWIGLKDDVRKLRLIDFLPLLMLIGTIHIFRMGADWARSEQLIYPLVKILNNPDMLFLVYFLITLVWLGILFVRVRRIFILASLPIIYFAFLGSAIPAFGPRMVEIDSTDVNNHRYYAARFDEPYRTVVSEGIYVSPAPTLFVVVYKCDATGTNCTTVFEESGTDLSRDLPNLEFEMDDNQLLIHRVNGTFYRENEELTDVVAVIEENLSEVEE